MDNENKTTKSADIIDLNSSVPVSEPIYKPHTFNFVLIFVFCIFAILVSVYLFFGNRATNTPSSVNDVTDTNKLTENGFPGSYEECFDKTKNSIENFDEKTKTYAADLNFQCTFNVSNNQTNRKAYDFCMQNGGKQTASYQVKCIDCPDIPASCSLTYYNPKMNLPRTYGECRKFSNKEGFPYLRTGLDFCEVEVSLQGAVNAVSTQKLMDDCSQTNTEMSLIEKDDSHCKLTFYKYVCPEENTIYCIDPKDEHNKYVCSDEAQNWYKTNCPNYKGIASEQN